MSLPSSSISSIDRSFRSDILKEYLLTDETLDKALAQGCNISIFHRANVVTRLGGLHEYVFRNPRWHGAKIARTVYTFAASLLMQILRVECRGMRKYIPLRVAGPCIQVRGRLTCRWTGVLQSVAWLCRDNILDLSTALNQTHQLWRTSARVYNMYIRVNISRFKFASPSRGSRECIEH